MGVEDGSLRAAEAKVGWLGLRVGALSAFIE